MSAAERIQPFIVAVHKGDTFAAAGQADPEMLDYARDEVARLRQTGETTGRIPAEHDYESRIRCLALEKLLALWTAS